MERQVAFDDAGLGHLVDFADVAHYIANSQTDNLFNDGSDNIPQAEIVEQLQELGDHWKIELTDPPGKKKVIYLQRIKGDKNRNRSERTRR